MAKKRLSVIEQLTSGVDLTVTESSTAPANIGNTTTGGHRFESTSRQAIDSARILHVNPRDCLPFAYNDREFASLTQADVQDLIDGFMASDIGQIEPCIARKKEDGKYEIIAGTRRLKAALWLLDNTPVNFKLQILLRNITTDVEALQIMRGENSYNPPSAYERAISTKKHIDQLFAGNQSEYARVMSVPRNSINVLLAFTQIPDVILDAYASRRQVPLEHASKYRILLQKHEAIPLWKKTLLNKANELSKAIDKLASPQVLSVLTKAADDAIKAKVSPPKKSSYAIAGKKNAVLATVYPDGSLALQLDAVCQKNKDETVRLLTNLMHGK